MMPEWDVLVGAALGVLDSLGLTQAITAVVVLMLAGYFISWLRDLRR